MLTYHLDFSESKKKSQPLYEQLYDLIKSDIAAGKIAEGEKLPSKRTFSQNLGVSTITVESAYDMLLSEGFIFSVPKSGYFVAKAARNFGSAAHKKQAIQCAFSAPKKDFDFDFVSANTLPQLFPFSIWAHLTRQVLSEKANSLMRASECGGTNELKTAILHHLEQFRALNATEQQIVIGAGTEYLYSLLVQLLGFDKIWAVEEPGYTKIASIYEAHRLRVAHIALDEEGISIDALEKSGAHIAHISPSHHFPTGKTTSDARRRALLDWANQKAGRFIIEDDYDSELRLDGYPVPPLQNSDTTGKVIYINTFSKTLSSTLRVSYMVLPVALADLFYQKLGFYSNTVPVINQHTLAAFIADGFFEKHINRLRRHYTEVRDALIREIKKNAALKDAQILGENAGLHFLLRLNTKKTDKEIVEKAKENAIRIKCLSDYFYTPQHSDTHTLVINYSSIPHSAAEIQNAVSRIARIV